MYNTPPRSSVSEMYKTERNEALGWIRNVGKLMEKMVEGGKDRVGLFHL